MVPTTQLALADVLGLDVCRVVDSFRPVLVFGAAVPRGRAELGLAQRRCIALCRKREATLRFDVEIPPYPGHASFSTCWGGECEVLHLLVSRCW